MTAQPVSEYFEFADYFGVLRRRWLMIAVFAIVGIVLGAAYYYVAPRVYTASVLIQVNALPTNANALGGRTGGPVNMDNEGQIVQSATVATIAQSKLRTSLTITALLKDIHVTVPPNTTFLQVSCSMGNARLAERCSNAFGRAYLYNRRFSALGVITSGLKQLGSQASALETGIEQLRAKLGRGGGLASGSAARGVAQLQLSSRLARLNTIQNKIAAVTPLEASLTAKNNFVGQIVTPAVVPFKPVSPKKKLLLPSGLAVGLVIGLIFAFFWDWRRPRIRSVRDVRRRISVPTVISLLDVKNGAQTAFPPPRSRTGQAYSELGQSVGAGLGEGHHVLIIVGTSPGSGNGAAAANLASALARTRGETMLICADPNAVPVPRLLGKADGRGFAEVLAGTAVVTDVTRRAADLPQLRVLTPGLDAAGAVYDMQFDKVQRLMRDLRREVRYVVIDVPAPGADADIFGLAEFAEGAIVVVQSGISHPDDLTDCAERLDRMRTTVLAAVLLPGGASAGRRRPGREAEASPGRNSLARASSPSILPGLRDDYVADEEPASYQPSRHAQPSESMAAPPTRSAQAAHHADYLADYPPDYQPPLPAGDPTQKPKPPRSQPSTSPPSPPSPPSPASPPVLRPVATGRSGTSGGPGVPGAPASSATTISGNSASRHAAPNRTGADPEANPAGAASRSGAWKPRTVNETWPLPRTAVSEHDEEPGGSDPLNGG